MLTTNRCPVTGGAPTRMSETAFRSVCGKRRDGVWVDPGLGYAPFFSASKRCGECKGKRANWPEELDIIKPEEQTMGTKTTKTTKSADGTTELMAKLALRENELGQMREYADAAKRALAAVLPHEDEGLDDTRSYADLPELAGRAARRIMVDAAQLDTLRDLLKPGEDETLVTAATSNAKAARAWAALMDRARDAGFGELAEGDPVVMAGTYIMAINEVMAERDRLKAELAEARMRRICADPASDPVNDALLEWALKRVASGKLAVRVQVSDVDAAEAAA